MTERCITATTKRGTHKPSSVYYILYTRARSSLPNVCQAAFGVTSSKGRRFDGFDDQAAVKHCQVN